MYIHAIGTSALRQPQVLTRFGGKRGNSIQGFAVNAYLETNLWNALCDHAVDADTIMGSLGSLAIRSL